ETKPLVEGLVAILVGAACDRVAPGEEGSGETAEHGDHGSDRYGEEDPITPHSRCETDRDKGAGPENRTEAGQDRPGKSDHPCQPFVQNRESGSTRSLSWELLFRTEFTSLDTSCSITSA